MHRIRDNHVAGHAAGQEGMALLLALLFVTLLSVIVVEFCYETQVDAALATNEASDFDAYIAAKSAIAGGLALLATDLIEVEAFAGAEFDSYLDLWAMPAPVEPINEGVMRCAIADEYGKLNLNALIRFDENGESVESGLLIEALRILLSLRVDMLALEEDPTDAILDWLDTDSEPREFGAEEDFYSALEIPYPCKNGAMDSIEELLLIRGVIPELFLGTLEDEEGVELPPEEQLLPLTEYLTVHGDPQGRVNVNTAEPEILDAIFEVWKLAGPREVENILNRQDTEVPFMSMEELDTIFRDPGQGNRSIPVETVVTVSSQVFRLLGDGFAHDVQVRIEAYVWRNPGTGAPQEDIQALEAFRILDWRVIR